MTDPMELVGRLENGSDRFLKWAYKEPYSGAPVISIPRHPDNIDALLTEAAACIREMVEQRAGLYDAVSLGFYDGFRDAITSDPWEDCYDYAAAKGADYAKSVMARIIAKQAADPSRRLNPLPPAPGAEDE